MKAVQFQSEGVAVITDLPVAAIRPRHALVRIKASGLCHTDIDILHGRYGAGAFPIVPGHEFAGVVEAVADDVSTLEVGARVVADPNIACGHCASCRKGLANLCERLEAYGVTRDGGFAEYCLVDVGHLHDIGDLAFDTAALAEPLACVLNGLDASGVTAPGARRPEAALVIGAGPIGLLLALALKSAGAGRVVVADINEHRLVFAQSLGLEVMAPGSSALEAMKRGFDFAADATGVASVAATLPSYVADGGTVLFFGVCAPDARIEIAPFEIFRRQLRLCGAHSLNGQIERALALLRSDVGGMSRLVSHRLPLDEVGPFFRKGGAGPDTMKVQFSA
ncbi:zinc-dependent alcohol dehydrogenase family protein [Aureimonas sp. AU40]|uniref:zinc-dependent alcohol dehydrogenase family protein n=1 Tax=Aureimonas sp. AU40 TaxID=1637747 RepID=UPI0007836655|nr:zinc-dependent alcohol dehydrogenase family protein [Aureimonas sp. AU40]